MKKKDTTERQKPRLPQEGRDRIRQGGAHQNKKKYKRDKNRAHTEDNVRDDEPGRFLSALTLRYKYDTYINGLVPYGMKFEN